jgi:hypothetical protein
MLQIFESERFLSDHGIPRGGQVLKGMICRKVADFLEKIMEQNKELETMSDSS